MSDHGHHRHDWRFFRAGGFDQVRLDRGSDLLALDQLDPKLWVALSCPVRGIELDARTLAYLDADKDGHIRFADLIAALRWAGERLQQPEALLSGQDRLPLAALSDSEAGQRLADSARQVLAAVGRLDADSISLADTDDLTRIFRQLRFHGDGIITPLCTDDDRLKALIAALTACLQGPTDCSGEAGLDGRLLEQALAEAQALTSWQHLGQADPAVRALGTATEVAADAYRTVRAKIDDHFTRCHLVRYDGTARTALAPTAETFSVLASTLLTPNDTAIAALPLAAVLPEQRLPLGPGLNPAWATAMEAFHHEVVSPILGMRETLSLDDWHRIQAVFDAHEAWRATQPGTALTALVPEQLTALTDPDTAEALRALLQADLAAAPAAEAITDLDRLLHYLRDLARLANNFVAFRDFYTRRDKAIFQAGTLYLDGRSCDLCIKVDDIDKHTPLAALSRLYLVYCECRRAGEKQLIAAAMTAGDADQLMIGRNGVFYDRQGRDWQATIVRLIEHPISIREAFWTPYKRVGKFVADQAQKFAQTRRAMSEQRMLASVSTGGEKLTAAAEAPKPVGAAPTPFDVGRFAGIFAAIGLAIGALGTAIASVITGLMALPAWKIPLVFLGVLLLISGPAMLLAALKLSQRNLGPLLDASGWAVNARAKITIPFGTALTQLAALPPGAERSLVDPYAPRKPLWPWVLGGIVLGVAAWLGWQVWR